MAQDKIDPATPILVAESSPVQQALVKEFLEDFHFQDITIIKDGYELLKAIKGQKYGFMIIDHHLSKSNSLNTISSIRDCPLNNDTPIIFTYNNNMELDEKRDLLSDMKSMTLSALIPKPVGKDIFRESVEKASNSTIVTATEQELRGEKSLTATTVALELASSLRDSGEFENAGKIYIEAMLSVFHGMAEVYLASGKIDACKSVLREACRIDPETEKKFLAKTQKFIDRGNENLKLKRFRIAKFEFEAALYLDNNCLPAHSGIGESLLGLKEKDGALESFKKVLEFQPDIQSRLMYKRIGTVAFKLKEYEIAIKAYEIAIGFIQTDPELYYLQSLVFVSQWKFEDALLSINRAINLNSSFKEAINAKKKIMAWMAAKNKNPVAATAPTS